MAPILLQGGTVLLHTARDEILVREVDILIEGNAIVEIGKYIIPTLGTKVISCAGKIISPGFVDTHQHMWETALKGICEDLTAKDYFATMFTAQLSLEPEHVYWSTLAGCMEAIDAGTTTALDFAHVNWAEGYSEAGLAATASSGIRSVYAHSATVRLKAREPAIAIAKLLPPWFTKSLMRLAQSETLRSPNYRVQLGLGFDFYHLPREEVIKLFDTARDLDIQVITSHWGRFKGDLKPGLPALLQSYGQLDNRFVFSHMGGATEDDLKLLRDAKAFISSSPTSEMTLGLGPPLCFDHKQKDVDKICSVGTDCNCCASASMINELRIGLLASRGNHATDCTNKHTLPDKVCRTSRDAFNVGTIQGARALGMIDMIGSIRVGKKADLVIFNASTPAMAIAAQRDPVRAIIMHSSPGDIDTVIIDGKIRKHGGKLLPVELIKWDRQVADLKTTEFNAEFADILPYVLEAHDVFSEKLKTLDLSELKGIVAQIFNM